MCVGEAEQFMIKLPVFKERNSHIYTTVLCQFECFNTVTKLKLERDS